jgi:hypothetical protein
VLILKAASIKIFFTYTTKGSEIGAEKEPKISGFLAV